MLQAEFSILDFKATEEPTKVQLPLYIELKGKRIDTGCGTLTVCHLALLQALLQTHTLRKHIMSSTDACALHLWVCFVREPDCGDACKSKALLTPVSSSACTGHGVLDAGLSDLIRLAHT